MLVASPAATVPVLYIGSGTVLTQSLDIMRWAWSQNDPDPWLKRGDGVLNDQPVTTNDQTFKLALDCYKYANRHPQRSPRDYRDEAVSCLIAPLETALARADYLGRDGSCWAGAAVFPFMRQFAAVDAAWWRDAPLAGDPALAAWMAGQRAVCVMHVQVSGVATV